MRVSEITSFLEHAYGVLNEEYFDGVLPPVVITVQSSPKAYGHYTTWDAWRENEKGFREINLGAENLSRSLPFTIATLIHEMTHHYCAMAGIKDTSRGGTYHNKRFKAEAEKRGLVIGYDRCLGVRVAECFGLRWSDINWEKHTIWVKRQMVWEDQMWTLRNTKTKAAIREIDLQDEIYYYLKDLKQKQEEQKVCLGAAYHQTRVAIDNGRNKAKTIEENPDLINLKENGDFLSTDSSKVLFRIARDSCGIHFKYHNLRHTHASWLAEHNIPAVVVKKRLGHTKEETTLRYYQHITQGMRDDLLGKLNGCS